MRMTQSGNALFYVLIAVGLLAALSFAVAQSGRGNVQQISDERARLIATELIEYSNIMGNAVAQLRLRGVDETELCFEDTGWGHNNYDHAGCVDDFNKIYHPSGAGLSWTTIVDNAQITAAADNHWTISAENEVDNVGTTCAGDSCAELLLLAEELTQNVCIQLNDLMGVTNPAGIPPTDTQMSYVEFDGTYNYVRSISDEAGGTDAQGKTAACINLTGTGTYTFYKALLSR